MIFSVSGLRSTNILRTNSLAAIASLWGPGNSNNALNTVNTVLAWSYSIVNIIYVGYKCVCEWYMVTTVTCSTRKVTVAHPIRIRILCQVTLQYELSGSFVILAGAWRDHHTTSPGYLGLLSWPIGKVSHWQWTCPCNIINGQVHYLLSLWNLASQDRNCVVYWPSYSGK